MIENPEDRVELYFQGSQNSLFFTTKIIKKTYGFLLHTNYFDRETRKEFQNLYD